MSRCFPFLPPGYEKNAAPDDVNLIIKEKHKKQRHKEKKDKDKKKRSERKEKERGEEGTHKKDDRKQKKHKDKKDKKKYKKRSSEEKLGEKLGTGSSPSNGFHDNRILVELGKGVGNDSRVTNSQMVQKINLMEQRKANLLGKVEEHNGGTSAEEREVKRDNGWITNTRCLKVGLRGSENGMVGNVSGKGDAHKNKERDKISKSEDKKRKREKKEQIKRIENGGHVLDFCNNKPADLHKEGGDSLITLPKDNGIEPNNISRTASSSHQVSQNGSGLSPSQNHINSAVERRRAIMNHNVNGKFSSSPSATKNVRIMEPGQPANNVTKVDQEIINNLRFDDEIPSSRPVMENGRKMAPPNIANGVRWREPDTNHKMDIKESRTNGVLEGSDASYAYVKSKEKVDTYRKLPPHLCVPKVEWPQIDDQEWIFGCKNSQPKRPKLGFSQTEWIRQVWSEAIQLESADVTALPYVLPY